MKPLKPMGPRRRKLLELGARVAFANPFAGEIEGLSLEDLGGPRRAGRTDALVHLLPGLEAELAALQAEGRGRLDLARPEEREALETVIVFCVYHRLIEDLDRLIERQIDAGDEPCPAPFARRALEHLRRWGISARDSLRHLAMLYQLRRAYSFIGRGLLGRSPCMHELRRRLWNNVVTHDIRLYARHLMGRMDDFSTLLLGETGTGKGTAAAAIGRSGWIPFDESRGAFVESFTHAFTSINLSQFPEALLESELFGHKKGAFTGAIDAHEGALSRTSPHGAIFLDEIGDVSAQVQIKLLQVLQDRVFAPVGSHELRRFRGRIVAATNRPIAELRARGAFRDDFYYRLSSDLITVPSLRQRIEEEPEELRVMLGATIRRLVGEESETLVEAALEAIRVGLPPGYAWPGNVRELEQCARSVLLTGRYEGDAAAPPASRSGLDAALLEASLDAPGLLRAYCGTLFRAHGTYAEVARRTGLDRRTVKRYVEPGA